jgi:hypothetical protein
MRGLAHDLIENPAGDVQEIESIRFAAPREVLDASFYPMAVRAMSVVGQ